MLLSHKDSTFSSTQSVCVAIAIPNMHIHMYEFSENKLNEQNNFHFIITYSNGEAFMFLLHPLERKL